jgi:hypothetical protein
MASTLCGFRTRLLLSLDPHVSVEAVEEAADTVVSEDKVRCKGDNRGGGGGVGGGEMLERLELTAESLSLSSSTEWCPGVGALLPVDNLYSKLRSDLRGSVVLSSETGGSTVFLQLGNEVCGSS